ncbi:MAG: HNH endonuclease domain-containing protein [Kiritimatiellia bacterium]|jgi:CRISPR-associated endonuclease Csn1|nr:HNH endonuclease domain-containing protein [Kiritimatiellia bacterium]
MQQDPIAFSFDVGHSSIGWAAFQIANASDAFHSLLGTGVVLFPKDSCLAATRRGFRRSRRNIAARRSRIDRLKHYLVGLGVLSRAQLDANPNSYPWLLAARVLASAGKKTLTWEELWSVLRWYAHNRGYDGNALWAGDAADAEDNEDTEKVGNANALMEKHKTDTMAETVCKELGLDPLGDIKASRIYFKGNNAAFKREIVTEEVRRILTAHSGKLRKVDGTLCDILLMNAAPAGLELPARFKGGLLFGQYVPRFDNRIIPACRITGKNTPLKRCPEYLHYRWGRLMNNLTVFGADGQIRTLLPTERKALHARIEAEGFLTKRTLNTALKDATGCTPANTESYFLTEEMEEALVLDPVKKFLATNKVLREVWPHLSPESRAKAQAELTAGKGIRLCEMLEGMETAGQDTAPAQAALATLQKKGKKKDADLSTRRFSVSYPSGRAAYCREILANTFAESMAGKDSTKEGGCLYETEKIRNRLAQEPLEKQTNNHLVRHRLLIFERLLDQMVEEYAGGDKKRVVATVVEVVRELQEFSGLNAKEIAQKLNEKLGNFRAVVKSLEEAIADSKENVAITGSLIRKARILEDQGFICPYTGASLGYPDLFGDRLEVEHIIPRSLRPSDALSSCAMTFRSVNDMKGQRTAMQFIREEQSHEVPGHHNIQITTEKAYKDFVAKHQKQYRYATDDRRRCERRAELMLMDRYDQRNADFTERDLTQTSHLNKMAIRLVKQRIGIDAKHLPGSVTAFIRQKLHIDECLFKAVPRLQQAARGEVKSPKRKKNADEVPAEPSRDDMPPRKLTKADIRELTHLHHAMDAVTQGLALLIFAPEDWPLLVKRNLSDGDKRLLKARYPFLIFTTNNHIDIKDLPAATLKTISDRLAECRVVRHIPAKMHGVVVDQTTWGIVAADVITKLRQKTTEKNARYDESGKRFVKTAEKKRTLLLGGPDAPDGKLARIKGAIQITENWGCALDPIPTVIPHFKVYPQLRALREKNGGRPVRILRKGSLIQVTAGRFKGIWTVASIKDNAGGICLDINAADKVKIENGSTDSKINVRLDTLLNSGMKILKPKLTGACPTTS